MTDNFKRFMTFSHGERIAIVTIVTMIVIMLTAKYIIINHPPKRDYFKHDLDSIIARREKMLDSIRVTDSIEKANNVVWARRATSKKNEKFHVKDKPSHKEIPNHTGVQNDKPTHNASLPTVCEVIDLNTADTTLLKQLPGIGDAYAKWIVNYREKLGGYCETEQLLEVYRMDTIRYNAIKDYVKIDSTFVPDKLRINSDAFKILLKHPYLEYDNVKKIVNYREQKGLITSWGQLTKIVGDDINPRLRYYIDYQ